MPLPEPKKRERKEAFLTRCMGDETTKKDFTKVDQRYAVCLRQWSDAQAAETNQEDV